MLTPAFSYAFDATLCLSLTGVIFWNFNRLLRLLLVLSLVATKLCASFCTALVLHTLLQLSTTYADAVYRHPAQRFAFARALVARAAAVAKQTLNPDSADL